MTKQVKQTQQEIKQEIKQAHEDLDLIRNEVKKIVIWQDMLIRNLLISLLVKWHIILEWVPGLAKTLSIQTLSQTLHLAFSRIQFTPDLLPSDLIWTRIFDQKTTEFIVRKWPIFANFVLADEINRSPSKVQSALLESMAEQQVTIWDRTFPLPHPFIVLATQNPIEQEWTYNLPEAQMDRFLLKTIISYPEQHEEIEIMKRFTEKQPEKIKIKKILTPKKLEAMMKLVSQIYVSENIYEYVKDIVFTSRFPEQYEREDLSSLIEFWASPRASLALIQCSKVLAMMDGRSFVLPEDIKDIAYDVLRHRIIPSYDAIAQNITSDDIIQEVLQHTKIS